MTITDLLEQCDDAGIELWVEGPDLGYRGDASLLDADALDVLTRHKVGILEVLK